MSTEIEAKEVESKEINTKSCFIITPIGNETSEIRRAAEGVIDAVIVPVLEELEFHRDKIKVAHRMPNPGSINKQLITRIIEDDLVIVNLTGLNPNVMYELAIRHAVRKPVVQICEEGTKLPFDIVDERTIFYSNDMKGTIELKDKLIVMVKEALKDEKPDNPIYRVLVDKALLRDESVPDLTKLMLSRLSSIEERIGNVSSSSNKERELTKTTLISNSFEMLCTFEVLNNTRPTDFVNDLDNLDIGTYNVTFTLDSNFNKGKKFGVVLKIYEPNYKYVENLLKSWNPVNYKLIETKLIF